MSIDRYDEKSLELGDAGFEGGEASVKRVLDVILGKKGPIKNALDWLMRPTNLDTARYNKENLPFSEIDTSKLLDEASRLLTQAEDKYHEDINDPRKEMAYKRAKYHYEQVLLTRERQRKSVDVGMELVDGGDDDLIEHELTKVKKVLPDWSISDGDASAELRAYFDYVRSRNDTWKTWGSLEDLAYRRVVYIAVIANLSTFYARLFGFFPIPHFDKISDVTAFFYESFSHGWLVKNGLNFFINQLNKKLLTKRGRELFIYKSFTRQESLLSMTLYGGLWITSEVAAWQKYHPLNMIFPHDISWIFCTRPYGCSCLCNWDAWSVGDK